MGRKVLMIIILGLVCIIPEGISQTVSTLANNYFRSPVDYTFYLAGNFGELRETHFHAGIDIKPSHRGRPDQIYAIGDGYVSRVFVAPGGYGRALYIDHPAVGYTSVYGHLEKFSPEIEKVVREYQMINESFELDLNLDPGILPITKSQEIGTMGNAGRSFGTHLHFEIRDTKTEKPINPFLFGIGAKDKTPPTILSIAIHGLDPEFRKINDTRIPILSNDVEVVDITSPIEIAAWRVGIAVQAFDRLDGVHNKNGIYSLHMYVDDSLTYSYHMDKISFDQTKNIIGFYDYQSRKKENKTYTLCYKYPGNHLEFLDKNGTGLVNIYATKDRKIRIDIEDFSRNKKSCQFLVRRSQDMNLVLYTDEYRQKINVGQDTTIVEKNCSVHFENKSLFRNIKMKFSSTPNASGNDIYSIHESDEPIRTPIEIGIKPNNLLDDKKDKSIIVALTNKSGKLNYGGTWEGDVLKTNIREFGRFYFDYDTIAPSIKALDFTPKASKKSSFRFSLRDNMATRGDDVEDVSYKVWIDDVFTICPLRAMNNTLTVPIDHLSSGTHTVKIEAIDHSKNIAYYTNEFVR